MRVLVAGHTYLLDHLDGDGQTTLQFVQRGPLHEPKEGVINQEVMRALIDRVQFLDAEVPWSGNQEIIEHLRMALALHEARAFLRHVEKGHIDPEALPTGVDGHMQIVGDDHHKAAHR